ncbi:MAG: phage tail protein [Enterocloster bolteae]
MAGTVLTNKGLALITKLMAAQATLSFSRVAVGTGRVPSGYDAQNMTGLNEYKMDATIESCGVSTEQSDVAYIVTQISSVGVSTGFAITEAGVFATDPDDGEILYAYLDLTQDPQYIYASTDAISKFAEITFNVLVGSVTSVTAIVSPGALVKKLEFDNLKTRVEDVETPEFDASGTAEGITDKTSLLDSFVTKMPLVKFMRNVVAGFKLVLYSGQIVNNCVTDRPDLPGSAAQLKVLMDLYTVLNTKKVEMPGGKGRVNISNNYVAPSDGWVRLQVNGTGNGSYIQLLSSDGYANTVIGFSSGNVVNGMLPLRKGATFTYVLGECTLSAAQFYPC